VVLSRRYPRILLRTYKFYSILENALCRGWVSNMAYPEYKSRCLSLHQDSSVYNVSYGVCS